MERGAGQYRGNGLIAGEPLRGWEIALSTWMASVHPRLGRTLFELSVVTFSHKSSSNNMPDREKLGNARDTQPERDRLARQIEDFSTPSEPVFSVDTA